MARVALLQMDEQPPRKTTSRQIIHLDICLPVGRARPDQCVDVDCQTCEEVLTRTQFEAIMKATGDKFVSTLENMQKLLGQHVDTIVDLRRKLGQQDAGEKLDTERSCRLHGEGAASMRPQQGAVYSQVFPPALDEDKVPPSSHLQVLKERHMEMKRQMRLQRRQHHLSQLSAEQLRSREHRLNRFSAEQQKPSERK